MAERKGGAEQAARFKQYDYRAVGVCTGLGCMGCMALHGLCVQGMLFRTGCALHTCSFAQGAPQPA